jgi:hypothetical protein
MADSTLGSLYNNFLNASHLLVLSSAAAMLPRNLLPYVFCFPILFTDCVGRDSLSRGLWSSKLLSCDLKCSNMGSSGAYFSSARFISLRRYTACDLFIPLPYS